MGQELNELSKEINRCLIQGIDEINPDTGFTNRKHVEDEMADVEANIRLNSERFGFVVDSERVERKYRLLKNWHKDA